MVRWDISAGLISLALLLGCGDFLNFAENFYEIPNEALGPPHAAADAKAAAVLKEWGSRTAAVKSMYTEFLETTNDNVFPAATTRKGSARYLFPDMGRIDFEGEVRGRTPYHIIVSPSHDLCGISPSVRRVDILKLPKECKALAEAEFVPLPLQWLLPIPLEKMTRRFHFKVVREDVKTITMEVRWRPYGWLPNEDWNVWPVSKIVARIRKRSAQELSQESLGEVILNKSSYQPIQMTFPDGVHRRIKWQFTHVVVNSEEIVSNDFIMPKSLESPSRGRWAVFRHSQPSN